MPATGESVKNIKKEPFEFRLKRYQNVVDLAGVFWPLIVGFFMYAFPSFFPWIIHPTINIWSFVILVFFQGIDFLLFRRFHKKFFFNFSRYVYVAFFTLFLYSTGGTQSPFLFIMIFPIVVSLVDLDPEMTRHIGITICIVLSALILTEPAHLADPTFIIAHFIRVLLFAFLAYFMYIFVREALLQKYEKEETSRKLVQLIQVDQLKNDFLSVAQHQLRTPLSGIKWAFESVATDPGLSAENKELVMSGASRTSDAIGIVNEMLKTAEEGGGTLTLSIEPVDIVVMVKGIIDELHYVAIHKNVSIHFNGPQSLIARVDSGKLKPSLTNIIDNALKYSPKGHVEVTLADKTDKEGKADSRGSFSLTVCDDGVGVSGNDMPFIFNRLYRGKNAILLEPDQSGVGLYTAKRIIELHGGTISLDSKLGKGTTIVVLLPK
jgi:signal transduction histidine kinase